jgi:hypothetical protein
VSGVRFPKERSGKRKSRFTDEQISGFLKQVEAGAAVKKLEGENGKLKNLLAEPMLDIESLKVSARGKR